MAKAAKAKATPPTDSKESSSLSWIPAGPASIESKKNDLNISTILDLKFISNKVDKFGRNVVYFTCKNPEALNILKEHIDNQGLNMEAVSLPFWQGEDAIMLRVGKQNCSLSDDQLNESSLLGLKVPCDFKYYIGKAKSGFSIHC
jgi:hypothetical protein